MQKKQTLLVLLIFVVFIEIVIIFFSFKKQNETISIKDVNNYSRAITTAKDSLKELKVSEECYQSLNDMINKINDTHFKTGKVNIRDYYIAYYQDEYLFTDHLYNVKDKCDINDEIYDDIYLKAMSASVFPEEIKIRYLNAYEIHIKDLISRKINDTNHENVASFVTKSMELEVLSDVIEVLK